MRFRSSMIGTSAQPVAEGSTAKAQAESRVALIDARLAMGIAWAIAIIVFSPLLSGDTPNIFGVIVVAFAIAIYANLRKRSLRLERAVWVTAARAAITAELTKLNRQ